MRMWCILLLLAGVYLYWLTPAPAFGQAPGLEPALDHLRVGAAVSPQYWTYLTRAMQLASQAFEDSYSSPRSVDALRLQTVRARSAAQELIERAPVDAHTLQELQKGKDMMTGQLVAWLQDVKARWGLVSKDHDADHVWNRYYEDQGHI